MNSYQEEQIETLEIVRNHLRSLPSETIQQLNLQISGYLDFRTRVAEYFATYFEATCTDSCYRSRTSACCSKDGIITFFADVVINAIISTETELSELEASIRTPAYDVKCIYLSPQGCRWRIKPIVCEFFLCRTARQNVFGDHPEAEAGWKTLEQIKKSYTWPDQPVLFESLEARFLAAGFESSLMYMHKSPGLIRIRKKREPGA